jgi:single-strand DNA-binding protein
MINKFIGIGRIGKDPEIRKTQQGKAIASFSIACSESWRDKEGNKQERTEWVNCTAFDKLGEICGKYLTKGKQVYIEGRLQTDKYDKDGQTHYSTKVVVAEMKMLGDKSGDEKAKPVASSPDSEEEIPF